MASFFDQPRGFVRRVEKIALGRGQGLQAQRHAGLFQDGQALAHHLGRVVKGLLGTDGRIHELKVLSGHPLLVKAAVDAVSQWTYAPTILNGQPVEVVAPITVTFKMTQ